MTILESSDPEGWVLAQAVEMTKDIFTWIGRHKNDCLSKAFCSLHCDIRIKRMGKIR